MTVEATGPVHEPARAKVNLFLHVTGRRADGYHTLQSLVAFADIGDTLTAEPSGMLSLSLDGPYGDLLEVSENNLVLRAAMALQDVVHARTGRRPGAALLLTKRLPLASGIGGGSADAAATLRLLCRLWGLDLSDADMETLALRLGADVPVCLGSRSRMMGGIGDLLTPTPALPPMRIVLANPGKGLETRGVFAERANAPFSAPVTMPGAFKDARALADWLRDGTRNDLEAAARSILPTIGQATDALGALPGALHAGMSGSGATCFALFAEAAAATEAARTLRSAQPDWWVEAGAIV